MEIEPYSIYLNNRPFKIAFLVDQNGNNDSLEKVINYNRDKWGGRFNPIILTDGKMVQKDWWEFLRGYDPDIIYSTLPLSDELKKDIHIFLSPLRVEESSPERDVISLHDSPISILPTGKNVARIARNILDDKSSLVFFEIDESTPLSIKKFLDVNFGLLEQGQMMTYHLKKALETCDVKKYKVTDFESLNAALLDLGDYHNRIVFPSQICSLPNSLKESSDVYGTSDNEKFIVVVGDTLNEMVYFWNRTLAMSNWLRTYFTQLWLSKELSESQIIKPGLEKFINRFTGSTGNNNAHGAIFTSFSLSASEIKTFGDSFMGKIWHPIKSTHLDSVPLPKFETQERFFVQTQGLDFHRAHSKEEYLVITEPDIEQGFMGGEHWFVDLYIQYQSEQFRNFHGRELWWQLPRRNSLVYDLSIFNRPARINENGMFSTMLSRRSSIYPDSNTLNVNLPDERSIFHALFCGESFDNYKKDSALRFQSRPFYHMQRSDKGMYLSGVLALFPDLFNAHHLFEERFWRDIFERMANHNPDKDEKIRKDISNAIQKKISHGINLTDPTAVAWLSTNVINIAKKYSKEEIDLAYKDLLVLAKKEAGEYNSNPSGQAIEFDETSLKEKISSLLALKVLLLGVKPKCPKCGYKIWYKVDDIQQNILCRGCGYDFPLSAEQNWFYRLNSLVRAAVSLHGTVALLMTLGQTMFDARSSAFFMPSVDLLNKGTGDDRFIIDSEIDLVCIKDGKFVIGEVKQSVDLFDKNDFAKMSRIAKIIRPDIVIFSSMDKKPNSFIVENIKKLQEELLPLEIKVEWCDIHYWAFDPQPVR